MSRDCAEAIRSRRKVLQPAAESGREGASAVVDGMYRCGIDRTSAEVRMRLRSFYHGPCKQACWNVGNGRSSPDARAHIHMHGNQTP